MMSWRTNTAILMVASGLPLVGCAYGELKQVVRTQFASEIGCNDVEVWERELEYYEPDVYKIKVRGCGETRTYTCPEPEGFAEYGDSSCTHEQGDTDIPDFGGDAQKRVDEKSETSGDDEDSMTGDEPDPFEDGASDDE